MNRFFVPGVTGREAGSRMELTGDNAWHAARVLRLTPGEELTVCDGEGLDYICRLEAIQGSKTNNCALELMVLSVKENQSEAKTRICLFQSLTKSDKLELVIQKAVELGVSEIIPFAAHRSLPRNRDRAEARYAKVSEAAAKQSGRGIIPAVREAVTFAEALDIAGSLAPGFALAAHEKAEVSLKARLRGRGPGGHVSVFIGPEGGFTEDEARAFTERGVEDFSLGPRILRTETAGPAAAAVILYELEG